MRIYADGYITKPTQPMFHAKGTSGWVSHTTADANQTLPCSYEVTDQGGNYDNSNYVFTAPVAGSYVFHVQVYAKLDSTAGYWSNYFYVNNASSQETHHLWAYGTDATANENTYEAHLIIKLAANDQVKYIIRAVGDDGDYYGGHTTFSGYLLG